jgi:hypothetical protein
MEKKRNLCFLYFVEIASKYRFDYEAEYEVTEEEYDCLVKEVKEGRPFGGTDITDKLYYKIDEMYYDRFVTKAIEDVEPDINDGEDFYEWIEKQDIDTWITHPIELL